MDSHPPLNARVDKARSLAIASATEDNRPAIALFDDLSRLELQLLAKLIPALKSSELKPMEWDTAGSEVFVPLWRSEVALRARALDGLTIYAPPAAVANLSEIAGRIPDPPGTLLTREKRAVRAAEAIGHALSLSLIDHGWRLHFQPGEFYMESVSGRKINPAEVIRELRDGKQSAETWLQYCETNEIADWPLAPAVAIGAH